MINQTSVTDFLKALSVLFFAMFMGQLMFAVIAFVLVFTGAFNANITGDTRTILLFIVPALYVLSTLAGRSLFKKRIALIKQEATLTAKLNAYRALYISRFALLEGATLFAIIVYLLTGDKFAAIFTGISLAAFFLLRPTKEKLGRELELSAEEME